MSNYKYSILIIFGVFVLLFSFWYFYLRTEREQRLIKDGNILIEKIEEFKEVHGRLPETISDLGMVDIDRGLNTLYYNKINDSSYIVFFGQGLGESIIFNSDQMQWNY